jgi:DNA-binding CsgD family transcriptional regulator
VALLAVAEALNGEIDEAEAHAAAASEYAFDAMGMLHALVALARAEAAYQRGDHAAAWEIAFTATASGAGTSVLSGTLVALVGRGAFWLGRAEEAARVLSASTGGVDTSTPGAGAWRVLFEETIARCRDQVGDEAFDTLWAEGAALSFDEALALVQRGRGSRQRPMLGWNSLTPTEHEVAGLVAQGKSNKDVAAQLFMSEATVKTHLTRIYAKVGVSNRAQLAASARTTS